MIHHAIPSRKNHLKSQGNKGVIVNIEWPAQSPDLNPIKKLFEAVQRVMEELQKTTSLQGLWQLVQQCWVKMNPHVLDKLVDRMPETCMAGINARGGAIDDMADARLTWK